MEKEHLDILEKLSQFAGLETLPEYPCGAIRGPSETYPEDWIFANTVLVFDFAPWPTDTQSFKIHFRAFSMEDFCDRLTFYKECDIDFQRIEARVEARRSRGPLVAIMAFSNLLDLTNRECIISQVYSLDYSQVVN